MGSLLGFSQTTDVQNFTNHELKFNAAYLILANALEVGYERQLNDESACGVAGLVTFGNSTITRFYAMPYYRFYFGSNPASGFFIEGFGMLNSYSEKRQVYSNTLVNTVVNTPTQTDLAIGFGLGGKFVTKIGIMFEINAGIGKNLFGNYSNNNFGVEYVGRLGLWVGKRY